jgi:hypothetical protein
VSIHVDQEHVPTTRRYIVNHDIMHCTAEGASGNDLYSGRALGVTEPDDVIQLHPKLKLSWQAITEHYLRVGLTHTENVIWDVDVEHLSTHTGYRSSVFFFGPEEGRVWDDPEWMQTVDFINSKNNFMALADELGIDVPQTKCFTGIETFSEMDIISFNMPCYLKAAVSVSGVGI